MAVDPVIGPTGDELLRLADAVLDPYEGGVGAADEDPTLLLEPP